MVGKGAFGEVYLIKKKGELDSKLYALKVLKKNNI
jgi:hypothetical protein